MKEKLMLNLNEHDANLLARACLHLMADAKTNDKDMDILDRYYDMFNDIANKLEEKED